LLEVNGISDIAILVMLLAVAFLMGRWVGQQSAKAGTPSASHNTGSTCASQIAAEMDLAAFAARNSGDTKLAELLEGWQRRLCTA